MAVTCAYGETLHGKTNFLASVIHYFLTEDPKSKIRLYTAENWESLEPYWKAGVLEVWEIDKCQEPFDTISMASMGYWPENPLDPKSKLIPLEKQKNTHLIKANLFEGMATFCDYMMGGYVRGGLAARSGRGERIGASEETTSFKDGSSSVGGNSRTHYNIVQRWIHGAVTNSKRLPGSVIWTSHEVVGKDDRSNKPILGPELVGTALTSSAPRWFGNTIHVMRVDKRIAGGNGKDSSIESDYRLYLKAHYSEEMPTIPYKAVLRVSPLVQEEAEKLIPLFIPNDIHAFGKLMNIRKQIDSLSEEKISELRRIVC
jgi:hypothetical protein